MSAALKFFRVGNAQKEIGDQHQRYDKDYSFKHALHPAPAFLLFGYG